MANDYDSSLPCASCRMTGFNGSDNALVELVGRIALNRLHVIAISFALMVYTNRAKIFLDE